MTTDSGGSVYWFAQIGDCQLTDDEERVLLFPTEEAANAAGVAEWGDNEYVFAVEAVLSQSGRNA